MSYKKKYEILKGRELKGEFYLLDNHPIITLMGHYYLSRVTEVRNDTCCLVVIESRSPERSEETAKEQVK